MKIRFDTWANFKPNIKIALVEYVNYQGSSKKNLKPMILKPFQIYKILIQFTGDDVFL